MVATSATGRGRGVPQVSSSITNRITRAPSRAPQAYRNVGVPPAKLGIGIGFFGTCWRGATGPRQTIGSGVTLVASDNTMSYTNIIASYFDATKRVWDDLAKVPYLRTQQ